MPKIYLSIVDFAQPSPQLGSINNYASFSEAAKQGIGIHQALQENFAENNPHYQAEVHIAHTFRDKNLEINISGRMDGIYSAKPVTIEEIKTAFDSQRLLSILKDNYFNHPYWLQLQTYGYLYWLRNKQIPNLNLLLVSLRNKKTVSLPHSLDLKAYEEWLNRRLAELKDTLKQAKKRIITRKKTASQLVFPFAKPRFQQEELMQTVIDSMQQKKPLLMQAPTGLGKTVGVLFPVLKEALARGQKTIYLVPKNSQQHQVFIASEQLKTKNTTLKVLTLTAKKRLCVKEEPFCHSSYCEFANHHFTKVNDKQLIKKMKRQTHLNKFYFKKIAIQHEVCPYELQMQSITLADLIIGDYNYIFSPNVRVARLTEIPLGENEKPNLIIDEAHNLPARSLDYYSPTLSLAFFKNLFARSNELPATNQQKFRQTLQDCIQLINNYIKPNIKTITCLTPPIEPFQQQLNGLNTLLSDYFASDALISHDDPVLTLYQYWTNFTAALATVNQAEIKDAFFVWSNPQQQGLKITCCEASFLLKDNYQHFKQVIGFSATLKPFNYYRQMLGLNNAGTAEFSNPFKESQRKLLFIPQVSTKYTMRLPHQAKLINAIQKIIEVRRGNYLIFFPSFDYLEQLFQIFPKDNNYTLWCQNRGMTAAEVDLLFTQLKNTNHQHLVFAVQGGVLSEGLNFVGDLAIGVFIVGPPLASFTWEREQMKKYYQHNYQQGLAYSYIYPAMAKAVQAAGRIIRSEQDQGLIIMLDGRFLEKNYYECMPKDWFINHPREKVSTAILADLKKFWYGDQEKKLTIPIELATVSN